MIPQPTTSSPEKMANGGRAPARQRSGHAYLNERDLSFDKKTAKVLAVKVGPDQYDPKQTTVMAKISLNGEIRLWPLRTNNPNLKVLVDAWGSDENDWADKRCLLYLEEDEFDGKRWIRTEVEEGPKRKR